ncbi:hypothetical protein BDF19DRAFT_494081 [Syncephalis fuscata]|nr:hypothetical protein BDF19DRAFT_494081 [Syncephalis fuscata]
MVFIPDKVPGRRFFRKLLRRKSSRTNSVYSTAINGSVATFCAISPTITDDDDALNSTKYFDSSDGTSPRMTMRSTSATPYLSSGSPSSTYHTARSVLPSSANSSMHQSEYSDGSSANKHDSDEAVVPLASSMSVRRVPMRRPPIPAQMLLFGSSIDDSSSDNGDSDSLSTISLQATENDDPIDDDCVDLNTDLNNKVQLSNDDTSSILLLDTALSFVSMSKASDSAVASMASDKSIRQRSSNNSSRPSTPASTRCITPDPPCILPSIPATPIRSIRPSSSIQPSPSSPLRSVRRTASNASLATAERAQRRAAAAAAAAANTPPPVSSPPSRPASRLGGTLRRTPSTLSVSSMGRSPEASPPKTTSRPATPIKSPRHVSDLRRTVSTFQLATAARAQARSEIGQLDDTRRYPASPSSLYSRPSSRASMSSERELRRTSSNASLDRHRYEFTTVAWRQRAKVHLDPDMPVRESREGLPKQYPPRRSSSVLGRRNGHIDPALIQRPPSVASAPDWHAQQQHYSGLRRQSIVMGVDVAAWRAETCVTPEPFMDTDWCSEHIQAEAEAEEEARAAEFDQPIESGDQIEIPPLSSLPDSNSFHLLLSTTEEETIQQQQKEEEIKEEEEEQMVEEEQVTEEQQPEEEDEQEPERPQEEQKEVQQKTVAMSEIDSTTNDENEESDKPDLLSLEQLHDLQTRSLLITPPLVPVGMKINSDSMLTTTTSATRQHTPANEHVEVADDSIATLPIKESLMLMLPPVQPRSPSARRAHSKRAGLMGRSRTSSSRSSTSVVSIATSSKHGQPSPPASPESIDCVLDSNDKEKHPSLVITATSNELQSDNLLFNSCRLEKSNSVSSEEMHQLAPRTAQIPDDPFCEIELPVHVRREYSFTRTHYMTQLAPDEDSSSSDDDAFERSMIRLNDEANKKVLDQRKRVDSLLVIDYDNVMNDKKRDYVDLKNNLSLKDIASDNDDHEDELDMDVDIRDNNNNNNNNNDDDDDDDINGGHEDNDHDALTNEQVVFNDSARESCQNVCL